MAHNTYSKIGIVGTGVIGASWAAYYLSRGFHVAATDSAAGAAEKLSMLVKAFWDPLTCMGLAKDASLDRLKFDPNLGRALADADFVQENGPERLDVKRELVAQISAVVPDNAIIATSSSGLLVSDIQTAARNPGRIVLGHPFNPPHLIPLVEVGAGKQTTPQTVEQTMAFYAAIGKKPIHVKREVKGHIANRLQAALWREAFHLVDQGIATVADIDTAIAHGPGLRWALLGPFMNIHLSGGSAGIGYAIDHLGPSVESWWQDLGDVSFTPSLRSRAIDGIAEELTGRSLDAVVRARDSILVQLLSLKSSTELP
jgi:carnitine 3-dehydrogenase